MKLKGLFWTLVVVILIVSWLVAQNSKVDEYSYEWCKQLDKDIKKCFSVESEEVRQECLKLLPPKYKLDTVGLAKAYIDVCSPKWFPAPPI